MSRKRFLVCGAGSIGQRHIRNLKTLGVEVSAWRMRLELRTQVAEMFGIPVHADLEQAMAHVDAVVVATATDQHMPVALAALRAGKHLFLEKPVAATMEGVAELQALATGRIIEVGCQLRAHPNLRCLSQTLARGDGGPLYTFSLAVGQRLDAWRPNTNYRTSYSADARRGGGALFDLVHEIDLVQWLIGPVRAVAAQLSTVSDLDLQADDLANLILTIDSGAVGQVQMDMLSPVYRRRLEIVLQNTIFRWDYVTGTLSCEDTKGERIVDRIPVGWERNDLFLQHMDHFLRRIDTPTMLPYCSLEDSVAVLKVALAAKMASETGQRVGLETIE